MRFREHGTGKPLLKLRDRADLVEHLRRRFAPWPDLDHLDPAKLKTEPYGVFGVNQPPGWDGRVFLVTLDGYGVLGYTDQPL